jgi:hypothetical protein
MADQFIEFEIGSLSERLHQPRLLGSNPAHAAATTTSTNRQRRHASDYFNYSCWLETSWGWVSYHRQIVGTSSSQLASSTIITASSTNHPRIKLSHLYLSWIVLYKIGYLSVYVSRWVWNPPELHLANYSMRNLHSRRLLYACHASSMSHDDYFLLYVVLSFLVANMLGYVFRPDP